MCVCVCVRVYVCICVCVCGGGGGGEVCTTGLIIIYYCIELYSLYTVIEVTRHYPVMLTVLSYE